MANTIVLMGDTTGGRIYKIGKVGYDSGNSATYDPEMTPFTGYLKTERVSPAGEDGLMRFRRVVLRALKSGEYTATFKVWVDDERTKVFDNTQITSPKIDQTIVISNPTDEELDEGEAILEADIDATGTFIQVQVELTSTDIKGYFLPESIEIHGQALRPAKSRATAESA